LTGKETEALQLRQEKTPYRAMGNKLGLTAEGARQLVGRAKRKVRRLEDATAPITPESRVEDLYLAIRSRSVFLRTRIETVADLLRWLRLRRRELLGQQNFGRASLRDVVMELVRREVITADEGERILPKRGMSYTTLENELARERGARLAVKQDLAALRERLQEPYIDERGEVWTAPTAEAYCLVCRARTKWQDRAEAVVEALQAVIEIDDMGTINLRADRRLQDALVATLRGES